MELSIKAVDLEELALERERFRKLEGVSADLKRANEELEAHISSLNTQVLEAHQEAEDAYEEAGKAQGLRVQARFRVLRQLLL